MAPSYQRRRKCGLDYFQPVASQSGPHLPDIQTWPLPQSVSPVQLRPGENLQEPPSHFSPNGQLEVLVQVVPDTQ